jgi:chromosome partitioning protein
MRTIAVVSQKGGTTKTSTVLNLAAAMAREGLRVLTLDMDTQANLTLLLLGGASPAEPTIADVLADQAGADDAIVATGVEGVSLMPARPDLADVALNLAFETGRERLLLAAMEDMTREFDVCLVDTAPSRTLLTTNVLGFAREVLVPLVPCLLGYVGLQQIEADMAKARRNLGNKRLALLGVLLAKTDKTRVSRDFEAQVREAYGPAVFATTIPASVKCVEAAGQMKTIFEYARLSPAALAFEALCGEVIDRGRDQEERDAVAGEGPARRHGAA